MKRRSVIKNLLIIAGGIAILPSCSEKSGGASIQLNHLDISADDEKLLAEIAETMLPRTDTSGAKDLNLHLFVLKMVDDCHSSADQQQFVSGLGKINSLCKERFKQSFVEATAEQKLQLLEEIHATDDIDKDLRTLYDITKRRTIQGFLNSKYVMTDLKQYELIPGRYNGYVHVG